jgi:group I intron endonuclease
MTSKTLDIRWSTHKADARRNKQFMLHKAIRKYGEDNFKIELLEECKVNNLSELGVIEANYISYLTPEYNMTPGGEGHPGISLTKEKNGMFNKKHTTESIELMRENRKGKGSQPGNLNARYGKPGTFTGCKHSEETKQKMRKPKSKPRQRIMCDICGKDVSINTIGQHKKAYHSE